MTDGAATSACAVCGADGSVTMNPPRRTLMRGTDPGDPSFSVTVVLPDVVLCTDHAAAVTDRQLVLGWCDDERCRGYGSVGDGSPCGKPYEKLKQ